VKAASSAQAWIFTDSKGAGISEQIGKAASDLELYSESGENVTLIGITAWYSLANKQVLIDGTGVGKWPAQYSMETFTKKIYTGYEPQSFQPC
jgi:hypothetical protein